jgi:transcriptional regulator of acetoin/glycerol metabolism
MADPLADTASSLGPKRQVRVAPTPGLLVLVEGGKRPTRLIVALSHGTLMRVGRAEECELKLDDETASRHHAEIRLDGERLHVRDLNSKQGTFVDAVTVPESILSSGSILRVGRSLFLFVDDVEAHAYFHPAVNIQQVALAGGFWARRLIDFSERFASAEIPVLMLGETGVGKEVAAALLHHMSGRKGAFRAINCAAIANELADSELFGHKRGAFSGATDNRIGHIEAAAGGTLLLDEIGDLPLPIQVKLLRAIEQREFSAVGSTDLKKVDVRFLAATSRDLDAMVSAGTFRKDLLYRLQGLKLLIPPLRERREEIPWIVLFNLQKVPATISAQALERMMLAEYDGNVRELLSALQVALLSAKHEQHGPLHIEVEHVQALVIAPKASRQALPMTESTAPTTSEVDAALFAEDGNVSRAAERLGVHRAQIYRVLRARGGRAEDYRRDSKT